MYYEHNDWYAGLDEDQAKELESILRTNSKVVNRLRTIVLGFRKESELTKKPDYSSTGWPYAAADELGFRRACDKILSLLRNENDR